MVEGQQGDYWYWVVQVASKIRLQDLKVDQSAKSRLTKSCDRLKVIKKLYRRWIERRHTSLTCLHARTDFITCAVTKGPNHRFLTPRTDHALQRQMFYANVLYSCTSADSTLQASQAGAAGVATAGKRGASALLTTHTSCSFKHEFAQ
eukprot:1157817-Pelagomonas_calceolata.AAC.17